MAEALREEPPGGPESEAELSQRLARTKARSYGSTASVAAPLAERYVEHRLSAGDTLQGIALKYGVTVRPRRGGAGAGPRPRGRSLLKAPGGPGRAPCGERPAGSAARLGPCPRGIQRGAERGGAARGGVRGLLGLWEISAGLPGSAAAGSIQPSWRKERLREEIESSLTKCCRQSQWRFEFTSGLH